MRLTKVRDLPVGQQPLPMGWGDLPAEQANWYRLLTPKDTWKGNRTKVWKWEQTDTGTIVRVKA